MARVKQIVCDGCGKVKQDTNHWFILTIGDGELFILSHWNENESSLELAQHLCGQKCVIDKLSEWMNPKKEAARMVVENRSAEEVRQEIVKALKQQSDNPQKQEATYYIEPKCPRCPHPVERHNRTLSSVNSCELCNCSWLPPSGLKVDFAL